ncbi:MAG: hypothetical protein KGN76_14745, partial [Acidobacteriota bacterium]|nr:hypothetical protein [Acidobacteriota bacterium]
NVDERVQTFTSPLWLFVVAAFYRFTHEPYYTSLALSMCAGLVTFGLIGLRVAASNVLMVLALGALLFSRAFVDFSTSGLENPLTHLLLVLFLLAYWKAERGGSLSVPVMVAALLAITRPDATLLVLPPLVLVAWRLRTRRALLMAVLAATPLVAWEVFSLIYYGFPFPNTAYAKLGSGTPLLTLVYHGVHYLIDSAAFDPVTPLVIALGIAVPWIEGAPEWAPALGTVLYLMYLVAIGGDFMSGRFLTAPLIWAILLVVRCRRPLLESQWPAALGVLLVAGLAAPHAVLSANYQPGPAGEQVIRPSGVADEWAYYYPSTGLLESPGRPWPRYVSATDGRAASKAQDRLVVYAGIGMFGYYAGARVHVVDPLGLSDPLLARLPALPHSRIGHFERTIPDGYLDTLRTGTNQLTDPALAAYYDKLSLIVRGPIWSRARLMTILWMNLGRYNYLLRGVKP